MGDDVIDEVVRAYQARDLPKPLHAAAIASLDRCMKILLGDLRADLEPEDLTWAGWIVLMLLEYSRNHSVPITRLARRTGAHPSTVTRTVSRLERSGYVVCSTDVMDRRSNIVQLTPAGAAATAAVEARQAEVSWGLEALSDDEVTTLLELLKKVRVAHGDLSY